MGKEETGTAPGSLDELCINTIRFLSIDAVEKASSGHPGMPMGDAPMAHALWKGFLRHNPGNPLWPARDRFVLSAGHGSMLLYSLLHLTGYDLPLDEIKRFRQWGSLTPGHPEYHPEIGIESTTGPLGQGFATGVGMAVAQRYLAHRYNKPGYPLFNYHIYAITSDGDMMEGVTNEAASTAGHLKLGSLVYLYSDNRITIEGSTEDAFTEDVRKRFEALGWHVQGGQMRDDNDYVELNGNDLDGIANAIQAAKDEVERPSLIIVRTNIGYGSPGKQDTAAAHGSPLGAEEVKATKEALGWPLTPEFYIPEEVLAQCRIALEKGTALEREWKGLFERYAKEFPDLAAEISGLLAGKSNTGWIEDMPDFKPEDGPLATRSASGKVLNAVAGKIPQLVGGSADLAPSNNTELKGFGDFTDTETGRNMHFGVREHAMGAIMNGIALSRALVPYGATFLVFSDYMRPPMRLAAMMKLHLVYIFTHDSIGLGEDGPTHQPIEQLAGLRSVPGLRVIRPADAAETVTAWKEALTDAGGPVALILTRQKLPVIDRKKNASAEGLRRGAYVLRDPEDGKPQVILIATGSEVHIALGAYEELAGRSIKARVVSMPSWEIFEAQDDCYKQEVLPGEIKARLAIEAASPMGWHRYVGADGLVIGIERFGASAPYKTIYEKMGFTVENVVDKAIALVNREKAPLS
jgi:transketolase